LEIKKIEDGIGQSQEEYTIICAQLNQHVVYIAKIRGVRGAEACSVAKVNNNKAAHKQDS
jgi:hypothetical protein